jgi:hypothetical protein
MQEDYNQAVTDLSRTMAKSVLETGEKVENLSETWNRFSQLKKPIHQHKAQIRWT